MTGIPVIDDIAQHIEALGITEIVHFTRNTGMLGIARSGALLARAHLSAAKHLEYIYEANAKVRRDLDHLDYVNLSIDRINASFFSVATKGGTPTTMDSTGACLPSTLRSSRIRVSCSRQRTTCTLA